MPLPFSAEALFDAIDGIAYAVDGAGIILGFSRGPFLPIEINGEKLPWASQSAIGSSIFSHLQGDEVAASYRMLHEAVWSRAQVSVGFVYRCDAPQTERHMRMSLSLIRSGQTPAAVLYHSIVLSETPRVPLPLFAADLLTGRRPFGSDDPVVKLCAYCQRVAWPVGDASANPEWIEAAEYYGRGGGSEVVVSHAVCGACFNRVVGPVVR